MKILGKILKSKRKSPLENKEEIVQNLTVKYFYSSKKKVKTK